MSKKARLLFDWPPPNTETWIEEMIPCDCRGSRPGHSATPHQKMAVTYIKRGETVEADLEDGSLRSTWLKRHLEQGTCKIVQAKKKEVDDGD